jgi:Putative Ig domain
MEMKDLLNLRRGPLLGVLLIAAALVGCAGDGSSATTTSGATPGVVTTGFGRIITPGGATNPPLVAAVTGDPAPQISGVAPTTAKVGALYSFQPRATDSDNAPLTFAISGAPQWATFTPATGRLSGTPTSADVGTTPNIVVQVSNGQSTAALASFAITVAAAGSSGGSANLSWVAPTENTDGSALTDLGGYVIHYGTASKNYTTSITVANPSLTRYVVEDLPAGTYYFSMTSTATSGAQSGNSVEASVTIS